MRQLIVLLVLFLVACTGQGTLIPATSTPIVDPLTPTSLSPSTPSDSETPTSSPVASTETPSIPPTETAAGATTFPDPNGYAWQPVVEGLQRPVDLQPDGSGRLFVLEKAGRI